MDDYISRDALLKAFEYADADVCESYPDGYSEWGFGYKTMREVIKNTPAADVAPVRHGRWERDEDGDWYCTNCYDAVAICESGKERTYRKPYCPNCGAKMDETDER